MPGRGHTSARWGPIQLRNKNLIALYSRQPIELGEIIAQRHRGRDNDKQLTVVDLTGVATQDIEIAKAVYERTHNAD